MASRTYLIGLLLASLVACTTPASAAMLTVDIEARIDGSDHLILRDGTLQWEHRDPISAAVGRASGQNWPTIISTSIDGVPALDRYEWYPAWSAPPPNEIRRLELSSIFTGLTPSVAGVGHLTLESVQARDTISLVQRPHADNSYTTVVRFSDTLLPNDGFPGDDWYHARLTFDTEAEPVYPRPQVVRWEIEATLTDLVDLNGVFPDVRLGDPIRGVFKYDAAQQVRWTLADEAFDEEDALFYGYEHPSWFEMVSLVIENPRTGSEFYLAPDTETRGVPWSAAVLNNGVDAAVLDVAGEIARQTAGAEPGVLFLDFIGPATNFPGTRLPTELNLEDWPLVEFEYSAYDPQGDNDFIVSEQLAAEIFSLTPITTPFQLADYNFDDIVDSVDLFAWQASFGNTVDLYADGSVNGIVDAADYVLWRKAYEQSLVIDEPPEETAAGSPGGVPEPHSIMLFVSALSLAPCASRARNRRRRSGELQLTALPRAG